jgi:hypothetical protein
MPLLPCLGPGRVPPLYNTNYLTNQINDRQFTSPQFSRGGNGWITRYQSSPVTATLSFPHFSLHSRGLADGRTIILIGSNRDARNQISPCPTLAINRHNKGPDVAEAVIDVALLQ